MINSSKEIKYVDLGIQYEKEKEELLPLIDKVLASGNYILGDEVRKLESNLSSYIGTKYCITLNSGTDALLLALHCLGVSKGDEVITQPNSFIASASSIAHLGAKPIFVDVLDDQSIDYNKIENMITHKTKAIMPVHLTGRIGEFDKIKNISDKYNIPIVEDAAQSIGSIFKGKKAGSLGKVGCFSTHPLKNLNAVGDGGFFTTDSEDVFQIAKLYRNHGLETRENCKFWGTVTRMDEIQACVLNYRLKNLNNLISIRQKNAETYYNLLNQNYVFIPKKRDYAVDTFHTFVIQVKKRDQLKKYLYDKGINSSIHYPQPIHLQDAAKYLGNKAGSFKNTERQSKEILSLPINQNLDTSSIEYISENINNFCKLYC